MYEGYEDYQRVGNNKEYDFYRAEQTPEGPWRVVHVSYTRMKVIAVGLSEGEALLLEKQYNRKATFGGI